MNVICLQEKLQETRFVYICVYTAQVITGMLFLSCRFSNQYLDVVYLGVCQHLNTFDTIFRRARQAVEAFYRVVVAGAVAWHGLAS